MRVSVLICTYKRPVLLNDCLGFLLKEAAELPDEVVVVDGDNGSAGTIVDEWRKEFPRITFVPTANVNLAVSRNIGLTHCSGDVIALTDDDVRVSGEWVRKIKELHTAYPAIGVIGGKVKAAGKTLIDAVSDAVVFPVPAAAAFVRTVAGANASYKRAVIEKVGGYDEHLFRGEDVDYNWRAIKAGFSVFYEPSLVVAHVHRQTWSALFNQLFMYGRAYYRVRRKWKEMYTVFPHGLCGIRNILKLAYFPVACVVEPLKICAAAHGGARTCMMFVPLVLSQIAWRAGIVQEFFWSEKGVTWI